MPVLRLICAGAGMGAAALVVDALLAWILT